MAETVPLAAVHAAVLEFLRCRDDAAIFGAQAVNAYVGIPRMTQDVDILSTSGEAFANELCKHLHEKFNIAVRVRTVASGAGFRIYQVRTPTNRHLVDVRHTDELPKCQRIEQILVVSPSELLSMKVISMMARENTPKGLTDEVDILRILITFPDLKTLEGSVSESLRKSNASGNVFQAWRDLVAREILPEDDDQY